MSITTSFLHISRLIQVSVKSQLFSLFYLFYTLLQFSTFSKKEHKIFYQTFLFLLFSQEKSYEKSNANLFCSYSIIFFLFEQFKLVIEHNKLEVFYFSRVTNNYNSSLFEDHQEDLYYDQRIIGDILVSFLTESSLSVTIFIFIPTKLCLLSRV